jgi:hypothetical protein
MEPVHEFRSDTNDTIIYACGHCGYTSRSRAATEICCMCQTEGCVTPKTRSYVFCEPHLAESRYMTQQKEIYDYWHLPIAEDHEGWVYVDNGGHFFESVEEAYEALCWDDGADPATLEAYPCIETKALTPLLHELICERWAEQFDDDDGEQGLPSNLAAELDAFQVRLDAAAPVLYLPDMKRRVVLQTLHPTEGN